MINEIKKHLSDKSKLYLYDFVLDGQDSYLSDIEIDTLLKEIDEKIKEDEESLWMI